MWRGTSQGVPIRSGASFVGLGSLNHRVVLYPISPPDPQTGLATINWIDSDPVPRWVDGRTALLGDAAHVMYPVGSNGASQAIVDCRVLGAAMVEHGVGGDALLSYEHRVRDDVSALVLRNRGAGPFGILGMVDDRCGGVFDQINDVIPQAELDEFMARYRAAAGFAIETLNAAPPTITPGAKAR
jgi:5-methylphenazine-1-carboxylate 1-monooxygenase